MFFVRHFHFQGAAFGGEAVFLQAAGGFFGDLRRDWCCDSGDVSKQLPIPTNAASRLRIGSCETMTLRLTQRAAARFV